MKCPYCGFEEQKVLESRVARESSAIRRRRECISCNRRFTTFEEPERPRVYLIKRGGGREEFSREKLLGGLVAACRKRPVSHKRLLELIEEIERQLLDQGDLEVESAEVGKMALDRLLELDAVAYIRFASVYGKFESPSEFKKLVDHLALSHEKV